MHTAAPASPVLPSIGNLLREGLGLVDLVRRRQPDRAAATSRRGDGRPVLVIPGFLATDRSTIRLRSTLAAAGYRAHGWGLGQNLGARADLLDRLAARLDRIAPDAPVALVGWSLGGVYARELAKYRPNRIERVITLGSPFSGDPRANHAWRLYEWVNGHPVDRPPLVVDRAIRPPVKTIALWSRDDGIVAPDAARGLPDESDRSVHVACRHMAFTSAPAALDAIFDALDY